MNSAAKGERVCNRVQAVEWKINLTQPKTNIFAEPGTRGEGAHEHEQSSNWRV